MPKGLLVAGAAIAAIGATAAVSAQPGSQRPGKDRIETRAEVTTDVARKFAALDSNRDGFVTQAEIDAKAGARAAKAEKRADHFDPAKLFAKLDSNKDGKVTRAEADVAIGQRMAAKGKPADRADNRAGRIFDRADSNRDGAITLAELSAAPRPTPKAAKGPGGGRIGRMFNAADANRDGKVSQAEMQSAALQHFDRADTNRDGQVTPEERRSAHQAAKPKRS